MDNQSIDKYLEMLYDFMGEFKDKLTRDYNSIPKEKRNFSYEQFAVVTFSSIIQNQ
jgi:hypothetical protein